MMSRKKVLCVYNNSSIKGIPEKISKGSMAVGTTWDFCIKFPSPELVIYVFKEERVNLLYESVILFDRKIAAPT